MGLSALQQTMAARARYKEAMKDTGVCRDCGARLIWATTANDKRIPLDYEAERRFVLDSATWVARDRNVYTCHLNTCKKRKHG